MNSFFQIVWKYREEITRIGFLTSVAGVLTGMLFAKFLASFAQFSIAFFWIANLLINKQGRSDACCFFKNPAALVFTSIFMMHVIGLLWTSNFAYAFHDLRIKLPLLILPVMLATTRPFEERETKIVFGVYLLAIFIGIVVALCTFFLDNYADVRQIVSFTSHIRFSLNVVMGIAICIWLIPKMSHKYKILLVSLITLFVFFIVVLQAMTALCALCSLVLFLTLRYIFIGNNIKMRWITVGALILVVFFSTIYLYNIYRDTLPKESKERALLEKETVNGNPYLHDIHSNQLENGYWVDLYVCDVELCREWEKRSVIPCEKKERADINVHAVLVRYLTGKGLRKDSVGMAALTDADIRNIEKGIPNYHYVEAKPLENRIRLILWEMNRWHQCNFAAYSSVSQRFELYQAALYTIKHNFWFGVGTGDIVDVQKISLQKTETSLPLQITKKLHIHNQYLTIFTGFGLFGFLWFLFALIYPAVKTKRFHSFLYVSFFIIALISMLSDDTLETQAGVTFFALFSCLLLFLVPVDFFWLSDPSRQQECTGVENNKKVAKNEFSG